MNDNQSLSTNTLRVYCDGGSRGNPGPAASAFIVRDQSGQILHQQGFYLGVTTNNQAEYQAVIEALRWLSVSNFKFQISNFKFYLDSLLIVNQINGSYKIKDQNLKIKYLEIKKLLSTEHLSLSTVRFAHIPRSQNHLADKLVNQTLDNKASRL